MSSLTSSGMTLIASLVQSITSTLDSMSTANVSCTKNTYSKVEPWELSATLKWLCLIRPNLTTILKIKKKSPSQCALSETILTCSITLLNGPEITSKDCGQTEVVISRVLLKTQLSSFRPQSKRARTRLVLSWTSSLSCLSSPSAGQTQLHSRLSPSRDRSSRTSSTTKLPNSSTVSQETTLTIRVICSGQVLRDLLMSSISMPRMRCTSCSSDQLSLF